MRTRGVALLSALVLGVLVILLTGCGSDGGSSGPTGSTATPKFAGAVAKHPKPAAGLPLKDYRGQPLRTSQLQGKAVLVTFIYTHCPDICPLIVSHLHAAQDQLGPEAKKLQIVAVSVDPRGDTPKTVTAFLKARQMTGRMRYLIGSRPQLERVWHAWDIVSKNAPKKSKTPDLVEHSALIYGISATGKITTLYPANFKPQQIVHDVPLLAAQKMRRAALRALAVVAVVGALILIVVLSGTSGSGTRRAAPQLPSEVLVPPRASLESLRGKPAAVNFWASWCEPCRKETPEMERLSRSLHGKAGLIGVDYSDARDSAEAFIREFDVTYPVLRDPDGAVGDRYGVTGLPMTALLDARGRIVQLLRGPQTQDSVREALSAARS